MDIISFRTFLAAVDTGSFAGAAKRVNASASSVTERIKTLEHRLGARLFERDKRGCRLTSAGQKFMVSAQQFVRVWDIAQHNINLPDRFTQSVALGGQYALWRAILTGWLGEARSEFPNIAFRVTAGAPARLNRDLADGFLDMVVLYDPVFRRNIGSEKLFDDRLVLVTGSDSEHWRKDWRDKYVWIEWGQSLNAEMSSRLSLTPKAGLVLDLGSQSAHWLIDQKMAGFMPKTLIQPHLDSKRLRLVPDVPDFDYPAYICWRQDMDDELITQIIASIRNRTTRTSPVSH